MKGDPVIWGVIILLAIFSILAVYSSTGTLAYKSQGGNTFYYITKHSVFLLFGFMVIFITHNIPYKYFSRLSQLFLIISIPLLLITLIYGETLNQATRWLELPVIGLKVQPSDFAKLAIVMYIARLLSMKQNTIDDFYKTFLPIIGPVLIVCMLILPANLSTALIVLSTSVILMFIGRIKIKHLLLVALAGILTISLFIVITINSGTDNRVVTWQNRVEDFMEGSGDNFQVEQAKIAVATGGLVGKGPGNSTQRNYLPHPYSDFIYAIIIEEYGLTGGIIVLFLYLYLLYRAGVLVKKSSRTFPAFLAIGLALSLTFQAMINMAVAVNLLPVTGQTLPFVSMGGSSQLFTSVALGIILSVSRGIRKNDEIEIENSDEEETENIN